MLTILAVISCAGTLLFLIFAREGNMAGLNEASSAFH